MFEFIIDVILYSLIAFSITTIIRSTLSIRRSRKVIEKSQKGLNSINEFIDLRKIGLHETADIKYPTFYDGIFNNNGFDFVRKLTGIDEL